MSAPSGTAWRWKAATLAVLAVGWALCVALNAPGHLSYDSVIQLLDGRTGRYHTWHPPFMAWLLGLGDTVQRGTALYVAAQSALLFGALALLVAGARRPAPAAFVVATLLCASPLVLVWQGLVWKDVLYADLTVAGFAALAAAARSADHSHLPHRRWGSTAEGGEGAPGAAGRTRVEPASSALRAAPPSLRATSPSPMGRIDPARALLAQAAWMAAAGVLLTGAALTRQDGALALLAGAAAIALEGGRSGAGGSRRRAAAIGLGWLLATGALAALASVALSARGVDGNGAAAQLGVLQAYDLVGVVAHDPAARLDRLPPDLAAEVRRAARTEYSPLHNDALLSDAPLEAAVGDAPHAVAAQWRETVRREPLAWAAHRGAVFAQLLSAPDLTACRADFTGVAGPAETLAALRMAPRSTPRDRALFAYGVRLHGTPVYAHAAYALLAAALAGWLLVRRRAGDVAVAALLLAALAYAGAFLVIGVACDYRYLYPLDLAAMAGALHAAASAGAGAHPRRGGAVTPAS